MSLTKAERAVLRAAKRFCRAYLKTLGADGFDAELERAEIQLCNAVARLPRNSKGKRK